MGSIENVNLLYVGRDGGCQIISRIEQDGLTTKAFKKYGSFFKTSSKNFYQRTSEYQPKWLEINEETKPLIESLGVPITKIKNHYEIPAVAYESRHEGEFTGIKTKWYIGMLDPFIIKVKFFLNYTIIVIQNLS